MHIHEREKPCRDAASEIRDVLHKATEDLTLWETISVVTSVFQEFLGGIAKYEIRHERHGNYDTPGGWAAEDD